MDNFLLPTIRSIQYTIFTKSQCKYCSDIKILMDRENEDVEYILCDEMINTNRECFIKSIKQIINVENVTFPIVFYQGEYIGGYDDYKEMVKQRCFDDLDF